MGGSSKQIHNLFPFLKNLFSLSGCDLLTEDVVAKLRELLDCDDVLAVEEVVEDCDHDGSELFESIQRRTFRMPVSFL
jgi:hypothetical protein